MAVGQNHETHENKGWNRGWCLPKAAAFRWRRDCGKPCLSKLWAGARDPQAARGTPNEVVAAAAGLRHSCAPVTGSFVRCLSISEFGFNPNSEVELAGRAAARGAHAAGVPFSAARRKPRATHFFVRRRKLERGHEGLGGPPNPARGPRALPISISEFGCNKLSRVLPALCSTLPPES